MTGKMHFQESRNFLQCSIWDSSGGGSGPSLPSRSSPPLMTSVSFSLNLSPSLPTPHHSSKFPFPPHTVHSLSPCPSPYGKRQRA
jgi:hypothetical protein